MLTLLLHVGPGAVDVVRALVQLRGADVSDVNLNGETALCAAAGGGHLPVVRCLLLSFGTAAVVCVAARVCWARTQFRKDVAHG